MAENDHGFSADLTLAGTPCQVFGNDIPDLTLEVSYQAKERLNVRIYPAYLNPANASEYVLDARLVRQPEWDEQTCKEGSDLVFEWSNEPSFQFKVTRRGDGEELFSTYGHVLVFEDQFLELVTGMREVSCRPWFPCCCALFT